MLARSGLRPFLFGVVVAADSDVRLAFVNRRKQRHGPVLSA